MSITGIGPTVARLKSFGARANAELAKANMENAEDLVAVAKTLIPVVTGTNQAAIHAEAAENGGAIADFGPKAKVIEDKRPFVNPALKATRSKRRARNRKAMKNALALGSI